MFLKFSNRNAFKITWTSAKTQCSIFLLSHSSFASLQNWKRFKPLRLLLLLLVLLLLTDHNGMYLLALLSFIITLLPRQIWWPILGHVGTLFLPVLQIAAVVVGWKIGQYIMLGEWPNDNKLVPLAKKSLVFEFFQTIWWCQKSHWNQNQIFCWDHASAGLCNLEMWIFCSRKYETKFDKKQSLWGSSDDIFRLTSPWDRCVFFQIL